MDHDVFVSYATEDNAVASAVCQKLEASGRRCWIAPRDIVPGKSWPTEITEAISRSKVVVLVFSKSSNASIQVPNELALAFDSSIPVVPFRIDEIEPTVDLEFFLDSQHWLNAFPGPPESHLDELLNAVESNLSKLVTVGIVDDHPLYRQGLAMAVEGAPDLRVVAEAKSIEDFEKLNLKPDVLLLDLMLPGIEGSAGVAHMCAAGHKVMVVSAAGDPDAVVDAIAAGACGYLTKETDADEIIRAVHVVAEGQSYVSPTLASYILRAQRSTEAISLTKREREVLELLAAGETDQDIADQLVISKATVQSHLEHIRDKTGARRRVELSNLANRMGIGTSQRERTV